jgi:Protein of unknown function (DUF3309)
LEPNTAPGVVAENIEMHLEGHIMPSTILIVILVLLLVGALPTWGHSRNWGYAPSGLLGTVLIVLLILALMGRI